MNEFNAYIAPIKATIQAEHREMVGMIRTIEKLLQVVPAQKRWFATTGELERLLFGLQETLEHHFGQEESEGYLDEAVAVLPRVGPRVAQIKSQHPSLLRELTELIVELRRADHTQRDWVQLSQQFGMFAEHLLQHESDENRVLQTAFNEDFDVGL